MCAATKNELPSKRNKKLNLQNALIKFQTINQDNAELIVIKSQKKVLFQVFKGYNVRDWNLEISIPKGNTSVFIFKFLTTNKDSKGSFLKLTQCELFSHFSKIEFGELNEICYFGVFNKKNNVQKTTQILLPDVFDLQLHEANVLFMKYWILKDQIKNSPKTIQCSCQFKNCIDYFCY